MDQYITFTSLIGLRDQNLSPYRDARVQRYKSVERMMDLIEIAKSTRPPLPARTIQLDAYDRKNYFERSRVGWHDALPFYRFRPIRNLWAVNSRPHCTPSVTQGFYGYNYNTFTYNIRYRAVRAVFPLMFGFLFFKAYTSYRRQVLKVNLFDEYCYLRTQELVKQNEYLLKHEGKNGFM